eukprot:176514_1
MAQPAMISLKIKCLKSDDFDLQIDSEASVDDLKEEIVKIRNIEPAKQRLIYKGRVLKSNKKLKDYSISDQTTVHLIVRRQAVANPRNDEVNEHNSTNTNNANSSIPTGTTAISVAVVDGSNGAADVNSILNSVLSGFSSGNLSQQSLQNQIQSAMANNPSHVMNLRGLLNPGDNPNAPNDDDVSSIDGDDTANNNANTNSLNRILPELQPQFAVSNGRGGYSPVTLLPPVLRSCNAINLELDRLQRNYNRDVMGIRTEDDAAQDASNESKQNDESMSIDAQTTTEMNLDTAPQVAVEVQTVVADHQGNVLSNNTAPLMPPQPSVPLAQAAASAHAANASNDAVAAARPRRREYLTHLLDVWDRFNEVVNGQNSMDDMNAMDEDADGMDVSQDDDSEMKGNNDGPNIEYRGVIGFVEAVFDELIDYQNTIETGLNMEDEKDDDDDMEMKGNQDEDAALKSYSKEKKDELAKKVKSAGNMLVEIGTVLASLGHMINKMDIHRKTPRNRLRITGLSGLSHVVRTAVPVEISTIVSRGINMQNIGQQFQQMRQMASGQQPQNAQPNATAPPSVPTVVPAVNLDDANQAPAAVPPPQTTANTNTTQPNANTTDTNTNAAPATQSSSLLSSLLDSFAGSNRNANDDNSTMDVDESDTTNTDTNTVASNTSTNNNNNNTNTNATNPMSASLNVFGGGGGASGSNPLASLMSAFGGGAAANANRNNNTNNSNSNTNPSNAQTRNPLMLIQRTLKFLMDSLCVKDLDAARNENYSFVRNYRNALRSFVLNSVLASNDTPMRRHEIAMDYANGFGLFMISQFSSERRDVIRSLTLSHFRNHTPLLIDIVLDSHSESVFEERLVEWMTSVFSAWIYKLSLKFANRLEGVKTLFCQVLMNTMKYLNRNSNNNSNMSSHLSLIPQFVSFFVDKAKAYHVQEMQKQHASQQQRSSSSATGASSSFANRRNNSNEQWVMNVEESERNRWLDTIRCDQKRMKQCLSDMKHHEFSNSYLPPQSAAEKSVKK